MTRGAGLAGLTFGGQPLAAEPGGQARLLVPHL